ncbi:glycerophosphodiester phosphodiesterase [Massilia sp. W12]|uniref:glycerophosphodiester phosphodiesterase n=1 Tax=Massilia sp. W12 TaxID=3126507 RepID=UPI0030D02925
MKNRSPSGLQRALKTALFGGALLILSACGGEQIQVASQNTQNLPAMVVIGHRGASALRPEHTLAAYTKAIEDGADIIEPDLVPSKDGFLVARHENEISGTTNVADKPEFAARKTTKLIDNVSVTGWFTEDFTLAELKTLRAKERIPQNRPGNTQYDGQFEIPTLQEVIALAQAQSKAKGRVIGIYPETKHPSYFKSIGLPLEKRLVDALHAAGYRGPKAAVFIQSFEVSNLQEIRQMTDLPIVQLLSANGQPEDFRLRGDTRKYADLAQPAGLREIARYANGIGPSKDMIIARTAQNRLGAPSALVANAHAAGLLLHPYTFRPENPFLPADLRSGDPASPSTRGDMAAELKLFLQAGIDGFFTDDPAVGRAALDAYLRTK